MLQMERIRLCWTALLVAVFLWQYYFGRYGRVPDHQWNEPCHITKICVWGYIYSTDLSAAEV